MKISRIAILGGNGALGGWIEEELTDLGLTVFSLEKDEYNIVTDQDKIMDFLKRNKVELVVNCAAKTDVDWCEKHQETARKVNAAAPCELYSQMIKTSSCPVKWFVCFSTEMVFDGTKGERYVEDDKVNPPNYYGRTKAALEMVLQKLYESTWNGIRRQRVRYTVIRTSWLYQEHFILGREGNCWPKSMLRALQERKKLYFANDVRSCPTSYQSLADFVAILVTKIQTTTGNRLAPLTGIIHVCGTRSTTRWRWFRCIIERYATKNRRVGTKWVEDVPYELYQKLNPEPARRPLDARLDNSKARSYGWEPVNWRDGTEGFVDNAKGVFDYFDHRRSNDKLPPEIRW